MINYFGYPALTTQQMLQVYSLHNGWNVFFALLTLGVVVGIIGFTIGLAASVPQDRTHPQRTPRHHHAA